MPLQISDVPILQRSNVKIKNVDEVLNKIEIIVSGQSRNLQIISDYDFTLTKQHVNGKACMSSFGLITKWEGLPPGFRTRDNELKAKYQAIEFDLNMTLEEKIPYMEEWYKIVEDNWKGKTFEMEKLRKLIADKKPQLRDGTVEMCKILQSNNIPMLVLSAGLGDVLTEVLRYHGIVENDYFHVMSNFFNFTDNKIVGYGCRENGSYIHPFNKNCSSCSEYIKRNKSRSNLILMGDSLGDAHMDRGISFIATVLKIGFLYGSVEMMNNSLSMYLDSFDIVLLDDQTMEVPRAIIDLVVQPALA